MTQAKILIVEDDQLLREIYTETLSNQGYLLETAVDGQDGFDKIKQGGWDLILLDVVLPKISGFEVIEKLKKDLPLHPNKLIIFLTNLDDPTEIKQATELGNGYLIKSQITPDELLQKVKQYINSNLS